MIRRRDIRRFSGEFNKFLRHNRGVQDLLLEKGEQVADAAGGGHDVKLFVGRSRMIVQVEANNYAARKAEATDRTLSKALDAVRS